MATQLHRVYENFIWRIESISPSSTIERKRFLSFDPARLTSEEASGMQRGFVVRWTGSDADEDVQDGFNRVAHHGFEVLVHYSAVYPWDVLHELVLQDRHDIIKTLRDPANYVGFNSSNTTTDLGIYARVRVEDQLETGAEVWRYAQRWRVTVNEDE